MKRGWESADGSMHDGEFANWSLVHEEVLQQLSDNDLVGPAYQEGAEPVDPHCWWPSIDYGCVDAAIPVPAKAKGSVEQWGLTAADKLPRLKEMGLQGRSYESLVRQAPVVTGFWPGMYPGSGHISCRSTVSRDLHHRDWILLAS